MQLRPFYHSPFSPKTVATEEGASLLLQFILSEFLNGPLKESPHKTFTPFDWSTEIGSYNKVQEHAQLLIHAFPSLVEEARSFANSPCLPLLKPFVQACKGSPHLLSFLRKHNLSWMI